MDDNEGWLLIICGLIFFFALMLTEHSVRTDIGKIQQKVEQTINQTECTCGGENGTR